jgi:hypothetical protein
MNKTISGQNEIMFYVGIDSDDPSKKDYYDIIHNIYRNKKDCITIMVLEDQRKKVSRIWNELVNLRTWERSADYFMMGNDDLIFVTPEWDIILEERTMKTDHPFYLYYFDDNINGEKHAAQPVVSKYWVGVFGYFIPEIFRYFFVETWLFDIAKKTGVLQYIPEVKTKHLHFSQDSSIPYDRTYHDNRNDNQNADDTKLFNSTDNKRIELSEYLRNRIDIWYKSQIKPNEDNSTL